MGAWHINKDGKRRRSKHGRLLHPNKFQSNNIVDGSKTTLDDEPVQEEVIKQKDMDLSEVSHPDDVAERQLEGCTVIEPVQEEVLAHPDMA